MSLTTVRRFSFIIFLPFFSFFAVPYLVIYKWYIQYIIINIGRRYFESSGHRQNPVAFKPFAKNSSFINRIKSFSKRARPTCVRLLRERRRRQPRGVAAEESHIHPSNQPSPAPTPPPTLQPLPIPQPPPSPPNRNPSAPPPKPLNSFALRPFFFKIIFKSSPLYFFYSVARRIYHRFHFSGHYTLR